MDFVLTDEQKLLQSTVREFMDREIAPLAGEYDRKYHPLPQDLFKEFLGKLKPFGFLGGVVPEEDGGSGLSYLENGIINEELFRVWASLGGAVSIVYGAAETLHLRGNAEQKETYLKPIMEGELIPCSGITESNAGSNPREMQTRAVSDGDEYVINGSKMWISNGTIADICILTTKTDDGPHPDSMSHLIVDGSVSPFQSREIRKLGFKGFPTAELVFEDCRVPKNNLLGELGEGLKFSLKAIEGARLAMSIGAVGCAQAAVDASVKYARERTQFGKEIGRFQLIQQMIADMAADTDAARLMVHRAMDLLDRKGRCNRESSMAKYWATEAAVRVTLKGIQVHGAYGLSEEYPMERYFRDAVCFLIPDGTTQINQLIVGREMLGFDAFR